MAHVLLSGMAVVDFVFHVPEMPTRAEKYRADEAAIVGGGGAANAAVAIVRLGGRATLLGRLGVDPIGEMITADLEAEGVDCSRCDRAPGGRSSYSSVLVDAAGERQIVNFRGAGLQQQTGWIGAVDVPFDAALADTRWPEGAAALMAHARARDVPGVIDAEAPVAHQALTLATHIAFSRQGLEDYSGLSDLSAGLAWAAGRLDAWLCVTDGADGVIIRKDGQETRVAAPEVKVRDTLGAGDVWHGAFALALGRGADEDTAVVFANAAASLKCTRFGGRVGTPTEIELKDFMKERRP